MGGSRRSSRRRCQPWSARRSDSTLHATSASFGFRSSKVFHDRAFHFCSSFESAIAHVEILSQRAAERVELALSRLELSQLSREEVTNRAAAPAAGVGFVTHELADLAQRQPI